jgi:hypothetical protein
LIALLVLLCCGAALAQYDGHTLVQMHPETEGQSATLRQIMLNFDELDFWSEPSRAGFPVDVLVPPQMKKSFLTRATQMDIKYTVLEDNIQDVVDVEMKNIAKRARKPVDLDDWNDLIAIESWLSELPSQCAIGVACELRSIGMTSEDRNMWVFQMSSGAGAGGSLKPAFWIDATIHAREWLATGTILKIINHMVSGGEGAEEMLDQYDFFFLPVMNPDGYAYTWSNERLWRKNRATNAGSTCRGTDLNRNYNWNWGQEGVSTSPCSDLYCGSVGGSELETQAVQNEGARIAGEREFNALVTIHAYGRMWMHPWGNTINFNGFICERADDHDEMFRVANLVADEIQRAGGQSWARGTSCEVIYATTGATDDYMKGTHGVTHAICPELRGNSFIVANTQIDPSFREVFAGLQVMAREI